MTDQPNPPPGQQDVTPTARSLFLRLLDQRATTSGTPLQTHNGRNPYRDLAEEIIDAWQYTVQASIEHADLIEENASLVKRVAELEKRLEGFS